jgi:hypothetical protein
VTAIAFPIFMVHGPSQEVETRMLQAPVYQIRLPKRCVFSCPHLARKSNNFSPAARAREGVLISLPKKRSNGRRNLIGPLHLTKPGRERVRGDQSSRHGGNVRWLCTPSSPCALQGVRQQRHAQVAPAGEKPECKSSATLAGAGASARPPTRDCSPPQRINNGGAACPR